MTDCQPDTYRRYDPDAGQWVFEIVCLNPDHSARECACDAEMLRVGALP